MPEALNLMSPYVQGAFAGFAFVQLILLYSLTRKVLLVFSDATRVIERNTAAIAASADVSEEVKTEVASLRNLFGTRPCPLAKARDLTHLEALIRDARTAEG